MDGWTDGGRQAWLGWKELKNTFFHTDSLSLSLPLIAALISRTPALNGDARERNTAEANSYHDFCSN